MDPDELLRRLRTAVSEYRLAYGFDYALNVGSGRSMLDAAEEMANAFDDLDEWLQKGGFLPADWRRP